jgi:hypothetical protein
MASGPVAEHDVSPLAEGLGVLEDDYIDPYVNYKGNSLTVGKELVSPSFVDVHKLSMFHSNVATDELHMASSVLDTHVSPPFVCTPETARAGTGLFLGGRLSVHEVIAYGVIAPTEVGSRSSKHLMHQSDADATQMERAQNLANAKNIPPYSGTSHSKFSLISIPDEVFLKTANKYQILSSTLKKLIIIEPL